MNRTFYWGICLIVGVGWSFAGEHGAAAAFIAASFVILSMDAKQGKSKANGR